MLRLSAFTVRAACFCRNTTRLFCRYADTLKWKKGSSTLFSSSDRTLETLCGSENT